MDRAAKAVRRSGVKLLSLGGGHGELNMVISEQKDVKNTAKAFMAAQNSAAQYLVKWAANEDNRAIQDVSHHITELNQIWTEAQREFVEQLKEFKHMFDLVLEGEKQVDYAKGNLLACEQREGKIKKELKKVAKKATPEELRVLESRLAQAERQKDLALLEVEDKMRENEAVKLIRFKDGYQKLSTAYMELSRKCGIIFEAQRDITNQLPDALNSDLEDIKYTGSGASKQFVVQAKERVRQYKRQQKGQNAVTMPALDDVEPPPPYTPGDFYDICYDNPYPPITGDIPPTTQNQGNITSSRQSQTMRHRQPAINVRQQDLQRAPQHPQLQPQPLVAPQPQKQLHQKKQPLKQQKKPEPQPLPLPQHESQEVEAQVDVTHGPLLPRLVSVELPADGQPVGEQEEYMSDRDRPMDDRGQPAVNQDQHVGDRGYVSDPGVQQPLDGLGSECVINDLNWCSEDEDAYLSGAMGGMRL